MLGIFARRVVGFAISEHHDAELAYAALCERLGKVNSYAILAARPATPEETKLWMEGTR